MGNDSRQAGPSATILVANHNYGRYLGRCLDSALQQTWRHTALVVVDDQSSDDSLQLLARYQYQYQKQGAGTGSDFCYFSEPARLGQNGVLNRYLPRLHSDYLVILDADDWLAPDYVEQTIGTLDKARAQDASLGFCHTQMTLVDTQGTAFATGKLVTGAEAREWSYVLPRTALIDTGLLQSVLPLDAGKTRNTKYDLWRRIIGQGRRGLFLPQPLLYYRIHEHNTSGIQRLLRTAATGEVHIQEYWLQLIRETEPDRLG